MAFDTPLWTFPTAFRTSSLLTRTPIRPSVRPSTSPLQTSSSDEINHCEDPQKVSFGHLASPHPPTGYEPNGLAEEDNLLRDGTHIRPLLSHRPSTTWISDSDESLAFHALDSDLDDEQIRTLLASPLYLQEREASADRSRVYHSLRANSVSSSSHFREMRESSIKKHFFRTSIQILCAGKCGEIIP